MAADCHILLAYNLHRDVGLVLLAPGTGDMVTRGIYGGLLCHLHLCCATRVPRKYSDVKST